MSAAWNWRRPLAGAMVAVQLLVTACTPVRNPATGEIQYTSMTPREERELGRKEHPKILKAFGGAYQDARVADYVRRVGQRIAHVSDVPDLAFTFTVLDSPIVNAFALPGGYVYVSRGLLALVNNEAELAGVLGHEIGHVAARHTALRYDKALLGQLGALGATLLGAVLLGDTGARLGQQLGGLAATAYVQGYSREQEFEADQLGIRYLIRAGYDPEAMATFLRSLERYERLQTKLRGGRRREIPSWLASHPRTVDRIRRAIARARSGPGGRLGRDAALAAIDGLVYGDSPEQGWVEGRSFVHPVLRFRFDAPEGFDLRNTPRAVIGRRGDRLLLFDMADRPPGHSLLRYLRDDWARGARVRILDEGTTVRGLPFVVAAARMRLDGRRREALIAAVRGSGQRVYRFLYLAPRIDSFDQARFERVLDSLRELSPREARRLKPLRVRIHVVVPGETLASLVRRMQVARFPEEHFRVLNALDPGTLLRAGSKVKLIRRE